VSHPFARQLYRNARIERMRQEASYHLEQIAKLFNPGMKLTLVVRNPEHPDGTQDTLLTDDTVPEVIAALKLLAERPES
jgi:hypothetical protein